VQRKRCLGEHADYHQTHEKIALTIGTEPFITDSTVTINVCS